MLHVDAGTNTTKGLIMTGTIDASATVPILGAGSRLMFYPGKAAFSAGYVNGTQWDNGFVVPYSVAMEYSTTAIGMYATAVGSYVSTNNQQGAFIIGDADPNGQGTTLSGFPDEFVARFNNGYYFMTSGDAVLRSGVHIGHNGKSWVSICDKNRKENFEPLNGEAILQKLSAINFTSWNYKMHDSKAYRHYDIMAQDFNTAFGKDKDGVIGNDIIVNPSI